MGCDRRDRADRGRRPRRGRLATPTAGPHPARTEPGGLPTGPKWVFWGAVLYLVLPTDLVPDPVYLDDIGVLLLALKSMRSGRQDALAAERQEGTGTALRG